MAPVLIEVLDRSLGVSGEIHSNGHDRIDSLLLPRHGDVTDGQDSLEPLADFVDMLLRQSQLAALVTPAKPPRA